MRTAGPVGRALVLLGAPRALRVKEGALTHPDAPKPLPFAGLQASTVGLFSTHDDVTRGTQPPPGLSLARRRRQTARPSAL